MSEPCPTLWKIPFISRRDALTSRAKGRGEVTKSKGQLRPYLCACGSWHLTTVNKHNARKIKTSVRVTKGSDGGHS